MIFDTYHVDFPFIHEDAGTQEEGKHELVFLKQGAAHVAIQTKCEIVVDIFCALSNIICNRGGLNNMNQLFRC